MATVPHFCMIGGKWTTFRAFAEHTTDAVLVELGRQRTTGTFDLAIGGGQGLLRRVGHRDGTGAHIRRLRQRVPRISPTPTGPGRRRSWRSARERPDDRPLGVGTELTVAEIAFLTQQEYVVRLGDLILRRTTLAITGTIDAGLTEAIASVAGRELGWSEARRRAEIEELVADLENYHGVDRSTLDQRTKERTAQCALSTTARINRMFTDGGCLDVAIDHGVCNEPSFLVGSGRHAPASSTC